MPKTILTSLYIFIVEILLAIFFGLATVYNQKESVDPYIASAFVLLLIALSSFVYYKAFYRRNWARIVLLIWVFGGVLAELALPLESKPPEIIPYQFWVQALFQCASVLFLFTPTANRWYREKES